MSIGEAVKKLRRDLCLQQDEFAREIGVTAAAIYNYESGKRSPRLPIIRRMIELARKRKVKVLLEDFLE